jgi:uncharacterized protein YecE (DUF72 family)
LSSNIIRVGIGGWNFEGWRGSFYPPGLPAARELEYASRRLNLIEINGTYYSTQKPETYARWRDATPEGFLFSLKALRYATQRRVLAESGESVERFVNSGVAELGPKLGPIVWQLPPTKRFDEADLGAFLALLPPQVGGVALRHVLEVRHASFACEAYVALARRHGVATVFTDSDDYASFADVTGPLVYVRTMRTQPELPRGITPEAAASIAASATAWRDGGEPDGLPRVLPPQPSTAPRDVFVLFISAAKERAPQAAMAVLDELGVPGERP